MRTISILLCLPLILAASAQRGTVKSASLPIPGATVVATQAEAKHIVLTDENGAYVFDDLAPGTWEISVEMAGFQTLRRTIIIGETAAASDFELNLQPPPPLRQPGQRPQFAGPGQNGAAGGTMFQQTEMSQSLQQEMQAAMRVEPVQAEAGMSASESFLVSGSLSRGLQLPGREDDFFAMRTDGPFGGGPPGMDGRPGMDGPGGMEGGMARGMGGPGMMGGPGGPGGGPGGMMGSPGGMRGGPGGPGGGPGGMMGGGPGGMRGGGFGGRGGPPGMMGGGRGDGRGRGEAQPETSAKKEAKGKDGKSDKGSKKNIYARAGVGTFGNRAGRGRETMRGGLSFSLRNSALDATPYSLSGQNILKPSYAQSRFNASIGGMLNIPKIIKDDKTFFFFNYSGGRSRNPFDSIATLPSALERQGDFSSSIIRVPVTIFDPATGQPFPANRIPASRINTASKGMLDLIPLPNQPGLVQNYQYLTSVAQNSNNLGLRLGRAITRKDRLSGAFNLQNRAGTNAQLYGFRDESSGRGLSSNLTWTRNIRRGLISNARFNFSRNRSNTVPFFAYGRNYAGELGISGTSVSPINYGPPNLNFTNFGGLTDASPALRRDQTLSMGESIIHIQGKHATTIGGEYRRLQLNNLNEQNARGTFTFSGLATSGFSAAGQPLNQTGFDFADYLLGLPQSSSIRFGNPDTYFRGSSYNFYAQDDWRIRPNLTINAGLRYEFQSPFHEKYGRMVNLDIAPGFTGVAPVQASQAGPYSGGFSSGLIDADRNNVSPRFGIAWKPRSKGKMVVRGGYGWYYNNSIYNQAASRLAQQPPFASTATVNTSLLNRLTLRDGFSTIPTQSITNTFAVARGYRAGYAQTWSLSAQQELPRQLIMELGYIGTKGTRLDIQRLPNRAAPGSPLTAEQRRMIGNAVGFTYDNSEGSSIYHAGQARLTRRFRRGISANALYTYAKSIDNVSTFGGGGAVVVQDDRNLNAERGLSSFDSRHNLSMTFLLSTSGRRAAATQNGFAGSLMRDWNFSGAFAARSGSPFTARVLGNQSDPSGSGVVGSGRADATGLPVGSAAGFFNPLAFGIPPGTRYGNAARNTIPGPSLVTFDLSLARTFPLGESRRNIEFRVESNNLLNNVNYNRLATTVNASNYGLATGVASMRTFQAHLRFRF